MRVPAFVSCFSKIFSCVLREDNPELSTCWCMFLFFFPSRFQLRCSFFLFLSSFGPPTLCRAFFQLRICMYRRETTSCQDIITADRLERYVGNEGARTLGLFPLLSALRNPGDFSRIVCIMGEQGSSSKPSFFRFFYEIFAAVLVPGISYARRTIKITIT